jgi:predicted nucleic acid-binding Zn ribbon protein
VLGTGGTLDRIMARRRRPSSLERLRRTLGLARSDTFAQVEESWTQLVGQRLAPHAQPRSLRDGVLVVVVQDPAVAEHFRWSANDLMQAVNAVCGGAEVSSVEVRVGPLEDDGPRPGPDRPESQ